MGNVRVTLGTGYGPGYPFRSRVSGAAQRRRQRRRFGLGRRRPHHREGQGHHADLEGTYGLKPSRDVRDHELRNKFWFGSYVIYVLSVMIYISLSGTLFVNVPSRRVNCILLLSIFRKK